MTTVDSHLLSFWFMMRYDYQLGLFSQDLLQSTIYTERWTTFFKKYFARSSETNMQDPPKYGEC